MAVDGKITVQAALRHAAAYDLGGKYADIAAALSLVFESGTGDGQADLVFSDERTLAASASETLDLAGALSDAFGATLTFAKIKGILIIADAGNTNDVVIGNVSNGITSPFGAATHSISVRPGGVFLWACPKTGYTVTAATADLLKVANSGGTTGVTYKVMILGTSA